MLTNLIANQAGFVLPVIITFFISPFVVHTLGDEMYGIWSLIVSFTGHYSMLTLGIQGAATRYVAYAAGKQDQEGMDRTISSSAAMLLPAALLTTLVGVVLAIFLGDWFDVPDTELGKAQIACILVALTAAMNFGTAVFACILTAFQRFDTLNLVRTGGFVVRSALTVVLLMGGFQLVGLAALGLVIMVVSAIIFWVLAKVQAPGWRLRPSLVDGGTVKSLFSYGVKSFVGVAGLMLKYQVDLILIGAMKLPATDIAMYSLGSTLLTYVIQFLHSVVHVFEPAATQRFAKSGLEGIRGFFLSGSSFFYALGGILVGGAMVFANDFYALWISPDHVQAGDVLKVLMVPIFFAMGARFGHSFLVATARIGEFNGAGLIAGAAKVALAVYLIPKVGLMGAAWATLVPLVVVDGVWFVPFIGRILGVSPWAILFQSIGRGVVVTAVTWGVGLGVVEWTPVTSWGSLGLGVALTGLAGLVTTYVILPKEVAGIRWRSELWRRLRGRGSGEATV